MNKKDKDVLLSHTVPSRQKQVQEYLEGRSPGTMQRYAPDAHADAQEGWVETDQTVQELVHGRRPLPDRFTPLPSACCLPCW